MLLAILLLALQVSPPASQKEVLISQLATQRLLATERIDQYETVLRVVTRRTTFENRWQVNQPIKPDYLNLFVLRSGLRNQQNLPTGITELFGSCSYLGEKNIVVCDEQFVNSFLEKHHVRDLLRSRPDEAREWQRHNTAFLLWILGHELGHIIKRHEASHFSADNLETVVASSSISHQRELAADSFLVEQIGADSETSLSLIRMILDLLNAEIREKVGSDLPAGVGIFFDYNNTNVVKYMRLGTHPEYVVRLTRILQQLGNLKGNESLKAMADEFARHMREGA